MKTRRLGPRYLLGPLAPPIIWITYFMVVYLWAEWACVVEWGDFEVLGLPVVSTATLLVTLVGVAAIGYFTWTSWKRWRWAIPDPDIGDQTKSLGLVGLLSGGLFTVATIAVGVPALVLQPC